MNGFRISVLVLLALALGLMFYVVMVAIPEEKANYAEYQEALRDTDYQRRDAEHRARLAQIHPDAAESEADLARQEAERNAKAREEEKLRREEELVLEAGRKAEEKTQVNEQRSDATKPVALVAVYDHENNLMMLKPVTQDGTLAVGQVLAIRRNGGILCELAVEARDDESGQYSAYVKHAEFTKTGDPDLQPRQGDEVIVSPLPQVSDLPALDKVGTSTEAALGSDVAAPALQPAPAAPQSAPAPAGNQVPEADVSMIPVMP